MCGITGFCDFNKNVPESTLVKMTDELYHRGPDDVGHCFYENENANIGLGHRRLSILDLSSNGHQPMCYDYLEIVYNGEVYNFREIQTELETLGYRFYSESDTEVILKSYHKWGIKAVEKFNGMFAISIYDKKENKLTFVRDRAGVKPFFYYIKDGLILFASELKSFHANDKFKKKINLDAVADFLHNGYVTEPLCIFENAYKLRAGHFLQIDLVSREIEEKQYWNLEDAFLQPKYELSENEIVLATENLLKSACEYRMIADVPTGVFLSGGYDSSAVTALLQSQRTEKLKTFTIGFDEKSHDEAPFAKTIAKHLGTDHTEFYCTAKDALDIIPTLAEIYDEPFGDNSAIPSILVSRLASKDVKVVLSADGGDELFAGYKKYGRALKLHEVSQRIPQFVQQPLLWAMKNIDPEALPLSSYFYNFSTRYEKLANLLESTSTGAALRHTSSLFTKSELQRLISKRCQHKTENFQLGQQISDNIDEILLIDYKTYLLDNILVKMDRATMSVSLEGREPLLDYRLAEFAARIPSHYKYRKGQKKWILKQIVHNYIPENLMDRPKKGFGVPLSDWFKADFKELLTTYLDPVKIQKEGIFNPQEVVKMRDSHLRGENISTRKLWHILMFEMWFEKWM